MWLQSVAPNSYLPDEGIRTIPGRGKDIRGWLCVFLPSRCSPSHRGWNLTCPCQSRSDLKAGYQSLRKGMSCAGRSLHLVSYWSDMVMKDQRRTREFIVKIVGLRLIVWHFRQVLRWCWCRYNLCWGDILDYKSAFNTSCIRFPLGSAVYNNSIPPLNAKITWRWQDIYLTSIMWI